MLDRIRTALEEYARRREARRREARARLPVPRLRRKRHEIRSTKKLRKLLVQSHFGAAGHILRGADASDVARAMVGVLVGMRGDLADYEFMQRAFNAGATHGYAIEDILGDLRDAVIAAQWGRKLRRHVYGTLCAAAMEHGALTPERRQVLDGLLVALQLGRGDARRIERRISRLEHADADDADPRLKLEKARLALDVTPWSSPSEVEENYRSRRKDVKRLRKRAGLPAPVLAAAADLEAEFAEAVAILRRRNA